MRAASALDAVRRRPGVWALRSALVATSAGALFAGAGQGYRPPAAVVVAVVAAAAWAAWHPDSLALTLGFGVATAWWALRLHDAMPASVLLAAALLVGAHVCATLLAYGPATLPVEPVLALLRAARAALAWSAALLVWLVARVYAGHATPALFWLGGLAAVAVAALVAAVVAPLRGEVSPG